MMKIYNLQNVQGVDQLPLAKSLPVGLSILRTRLHSCTWRQTEKVNM